MPATTPARPQSQDAVQHQALAVSRARHCCCSPSISSIRSFETIWLSFHDKAGENFVGLANYIWAFNDTQFRQSIFNNLIWLLVVPAACTSFGLLIAVLTDRIWWGNLARVLIFMPLAISFVGASVIWKFVYDYRGEGQEQIGILNAIVAISAATRRCGSPCPSGTISS